MTSKQRVLFVCIENSCRSQIAEGFARALGEGRIGAFSAGSRPSTRVDPRMVRLMAEIGIDISQQNAKGLDALPRDVTWDWIVTMGCGDACPHLPARNRLDWNLPDPRGMDDDAARAVRDRIEREVSRLIELTAQQAGA
jgi:protein-tyrosine-phosphatase